MKIALLEFVEEYEALLSHLDRTRTDPASVTIIALEPRLQAYLLSKNIAFHTTLPYFPNASHGRIIAGTEVVMQHIRTSFDFTDILGLRECYERELSHHVRFFLNHLYKLIEITVNVCDAHPGAEFIVPAPFHPAPGGMLGRSERYLGTIAERACRHLGRTCTVLVTPAAQPGAQPRAVSGPTVTDRLTAVLLGILLRKKHVLIVPPGGGMFQDLLTQIAKRDQRVACLAVGATSPQYATMAYNLLAWAKAMLGLTPFASYLLRTGHLDRTPAADIERLSACLRSTFGPDSALLCTYAGVSVADLLSEKSEAGFAGHLENHVAQARGLRKVISRFSHNMVISFSALGAMAAAGELAGQMCRTSLLVSHGTHPVPADPVHETELMNLCRGFMLSNYTHIAFSTPVQEDHLHYFKRKHSWIRNAELRTGPLVFADIRHSDRAEQKRRLGINPDHTVLTYATTMKASRQSERFHFLETTDEFFSSLSDACQAVDAETALILRVHPGYPLTNEEIRALTPGSDRLIINRSGSFADVLAATDVLISYSSTAIDEALINRIPVVLYDKWSRYNHFQTQPYEGPDTPDTFPVCYVNRTDMLASALNTTTARAANTKKQDVDVSRYCYNEEYRENLYALLDRSFN